MIHLFVDASAASSGSGPTYVRNIVPHLAARRDLRSTILLSPTLRAEFRDLAHVSFVGFTSDSANAATRFLHVQRLIPQLIRRSGADVLLSTGNIALFRSPVPQILLSGNALYTSRDFSRDVLRRRHYGVWLDTKLKGQLAKWSVRAADCTVAPSDAFAAEIKRWTGNSARAIHHGFDPNFFSQDEAPLPDDLRGKIARKNDELRLLFVSHYNYYRNFETLFRALPLLHKTISGKVKLFLTCKLQPGENPGSYRTEKAAALARELHIDSDLVQLGSIPYSLLHHVYRACDVYVTSAYVETFAHPLVEAMASGLPVVASDLAVHREVCGDAALYFPAFSPDRLAEAVNRVALSPELRAETAKKGLDRSRDFSWKDHVERLVLIAKDLALQKANMAPS